MARLVDGVGVVYYNGIHFPSAIHASIQARPSYQMGEVSNKYVHYTLTIDTVLTYADLPLNAAAHQDISVNAVQYRKLLTTPGKTLIFGEQGFGEFVVNPLATANASGQYDAGYRLVNDVAFGPKPRLLVWEPIGSNRAAHVTWVCEFCIPECLSGSSPSERALLECTHEVTFTINEEGLLTKTTRATIEIAANVSGYNFKDTVDNYVTRFNPPIIPGFHRETHRHISRDHRTLNITYTDTEIASDYAFPQGMVSVDVSHTASSTFQKDGFIMWMNTMNGTFRWGKGFSGALAWATFANIVSSRTNLNLPAPIAKDNAYKSLVQMGNIPYSIQITEQLFNREASFSVSWLSRTNLYRLFESTGLFYQPVPDVSWAKWHASLYQIQSAFGGSGIHENVRDLNVVNICTNQNPHAPHPESLSQKYPAYQPWFDYSCSKIPPNMSWIYTGYPKIKVITKADPLPQIPAYGPSPTDVTAPNSAKTSSSIGFDPSSVTLTGTPSGYEPTYQVRDYKQYMIEVTGTLTRICYEPYAPVFKSYGGVDLVLKDNEFEITKTHGQFFPMYVLKYRQTYYLPRLPTGNSLRLLKTDVGDGDR